jgi:ethanolamine utilization protein EutQ
MRTLICEKDIEAFVKLGKREIVVDGSTMITPAAKDAAQALGIAVSYGCAGKGCPGGSAQACSNADGDAIDSDVVFKALSVLASKGLLEGIVGSSDASQCCCADDTPYSAQRHPSGLKIVRGGSVQMEYLDTGNPSNDVHYQELISSSDSSVMNAGLLEINGCSFPWEVGCDELYYVIQGPLQIRVNGSCYTAEAGDAVNLPVGTTVNFEAKGRAKMFYAIKAS